GGRRAGRGAAARRGLGGGVGRGAASLEAPLEGRHLSRPHGRPGPGPRRHRLAGAGGLRSVGAEGHRVKIEQGERTKWRIPRQGGMGVDGIVYASAALMEDLRGDESLQQVANVAHLPGILGASLAMPDIHWGYGFPIGGVAAMDAEEGVVSPGGVGYDI